MVNPIDLGVASSLQASSEVAEDSSQDVQNVALAALADAREPSPASVRSDESTVLDEARSARSLLTPSPSLSVAAVSTPAFVPTIALFARAPTPPAVAGAGAGPAPTAPKTSPRVLADLEPGFALSSVRASTGVNMQPSEVLKKSRSAADLKAAAAIAGSPGRAEGSPRSRGGSFSTPRTPVEEDSIDHDFEDSKTHMELWLETYALVESLCESAKEFDFIGFFHRDRLDSIPEREHEKMLEMVQQIQEHAQRYYDEKKGTDEEVSMEFIYKQIVGVLDKYDRRQALYHEYGISEPNSSFILRNAVLLASQKNSKGLPAWTVFTKSPKPKGNIWPFLADFRNWIPETQGIIGKWIASSSIEACRLARQTQGQNYVVLLRGGFGAGKTTFAQQLFDKYHTGVIAPDKGKRAVRIYLPLPHAKAHELGSTIAYALFFKMIDEVKGTVAYDSSLRDPKDLEAAIKAAAKAGKKVVVYDVTRPDIIRAFAVLARTIEGDDPRIPSDYFISGAMQDKLTRKQCMDVVYKHEGRGALAPEYHLLVSNSEGTDTQDVLQIKPSSITLAADGVSRCALEKISVSDGSTRDPIRISVEKEQLQSELETSLDETVRFALDAFDDSVVSRYRTCFAKREIGFKSGISGVTAETLYDSLSDEFTSVIDKEKFNQALMGVSEKARNYLITVCNARIRVGLPISYLDLPIKMAMNIQAGLRDVPMTPAERKAKEALDLQSW